MSSFLPTDSPRMAKKPDQLLTRQHGIDLATWDTSWQQFSTPKDILRQAIETNLKAKGQELPIIEKYSPARKRPKQQRGTDVSEEVLRKREKNRKAAMKCREKKRKILETLQKKVEKYENWNKGLEKEIQNFQDEIRKLEGCLTRHECRRQQATESTRHLHKHQHREDRILWQQNLFLARSEACHERENTEPTQQTSVDVHQDDTSKDSSPAMSDPSCSIDALLDDLQNVPELWYRNLNHNVDLY